jgi:hypothetical protein
MRADPVRHAARWPVRRTARWILLALVLACAWMPRARANGQVEVAGVNVAVRSPWPDMLDHGALPFFVDVENGTKASRDIQLVFTNGFGAHTLQVEKRIALAAGERTSFELFAPVQSSAPSDYALDVRIGSEHDRLMGLGAVKPPEPGVRNVIVTAASVRNSSNATYWTNDLSTEAAPRWSAPVTPPPSGVTFSGGAYRFSSATPGPPSHVVIASFVPFTELPHRAEPYASIDSVVIDASDALPPPDAMGPITAFVRTGGVLAILGPGAERTAKSSADLAPWIEERFHVKSYRGADTYACGQGLLVVSESPAPFDNTVQVLAVNAAMEAKGGHRAWIPSPRGGRGAGISVKLPGLELPIRSMALVLILFSVLIGPVNMYVVKRMRKPALLLLTVPAIALVFSILLFAYGAFAQGLDVRAKRQTFTLLDQRLHRSSAAEVREVFAGLSPPALKPEAGGSLWPEIGNGVYGEASRYVIEATSGIALGGDYMPVRTPVRQTLVTDRASRARVDVRHEGDDLVVQNALGADIQAFAYCASDGRIWSSHQPIRDGATAKLDVMTPDIGDNAEGMILCTQTIGTSGWLPTGTYAARLSACSSIDAMGVEARDVDSTHYLLGVLPIAEAP